MNRFVDGDVRIFCKHGNDDEDSDNASPPSADGGWSRRGSRRQQINEFPDPDDDASGGKTARKAVKDIKVRTYSYMSPISSDGDDIPQSTFRRGGIKQAEKPSRGLSVDSKSAEEKEESERGRQARKVQRRGQVQRRGLLSPAGHKSEPKRGISKVVRKTRGLPKQAKDLPVSSHLETRTDATGKSTSAKQPNNKRTSGSVGTELVPETEHGEVSAKTAKKRKAAASRTSRGRRSTTPADAESSQPSLSDSDNIRSQGSDSPVQTFENMSDGARRVSKSEEAEAEAKDNRDGIELDGVKTGNGSREARGCRHSSSSSSTDEGSEKRAAKRAANQRIKRMQKRRRPASPESSCESDLLERPATRSSKGKRAWRKGKGRSRRGRGPIECEVCGRSMRCRAIMERHMLTHTGEKPFECGDCGRRYTSSSNLRIHQLSHSGAMDYVCNECGQKFTHLPYLNRHMLRHAGKKLHICDQCGKGFIQKYHLERHLLLHTGKTPYTCDECGATFTRTDYLKVHMRSVHLGKGKQVAATEAAPPKSHKCDTCEKAFGSRSVLEVHTRVHTGDAPFVCSICQRKFKQSSQMISHMRTHSGEKPHTCDTCGVRFTRRSYVRVHKRKVHGASEQVPSSS